MKNWLGLVLMLLTLQAQAQDKPAADAVLLLRDHLGVSLGITAIKPEVRVEWGRNDFRPKISQGIQVGFSHYWNFERNWALETGFTAGIQLVSYTYLVSNTPGGPESDFIGTSFFELPLRLGKRIQLTEKVALLPQAGLCLRSYGRFESSSAHGGSGPVTNPAGRLNLDIQFSPDYNFAPYLQFALGGQFKLQRNLFQVRVVYSKNLLPGIEMMSGHYRHIEGSTTTGKGYVFSTGNSVVLETGYIFTRTRRAAEKQE